MRRGSLLVRAAVAAGRQTSTTRAPSQPAWTPKTYARSFQRIRNALQEAKVLLQELA
jgi:hypothetical protein